MKTLLAAATVAAALLTAGPVAAGGIYADAAMLATLESVRVVVEDGVKGSCLLDASGIKARLSATLERSGIPISEAGPWILYAHYFNGHDVRPSERRTRCALKTTFQLQFGPANTLIVATEDGSLSAGPGALDDEVIRGAKRFADEMIAAILAARRLVGASGAGRRS
jgi:hypothetical protein